MYRLMRTILFFFPAETVHHIACFFLRLLMALPLIGYLVRRQLKPSRELRVQAFGREFPSPIGIAAGFDKNGHYFDALLGLGFGCVEVGTVTGVGQDGNPKPRLFRLKADRAIINRMGFNNYGADALAGRLAHRRKRLGVIGANIGKTKLVEEEFAIADYVKSARAVAPYADYLTVNVSSPNTPNLRDLQAVEKLRPLLSAVKEAIAEVCDKPIPLLVKIAPDLADSDVIEVAKMALELKLDGIIATNTTISRAGLASASEVVEAIGAGGLSGPPVAARSLEVLRLLRREVGDKVTLISVGGIETADQVWERLAAGATLIQVYTGFIYEGPGLANRLNQGLLGLLREQGYSSVIQHVGTDC